MYTDKDKKQGNMCHLDNNNYSVNTFAPTNVRREKIHITYIYTEYNHYFNKKKKPI